MELVPHTDAEFQNLPHIILTSGDKWDPRVVDHHMTSREDWPEIISALDKGDLKCPFDIHGEYKKT